MHTQLQIQQSAHEPNVWANERSTELQQTQRFQAAELPVCHKVPQYQCCTSAHAFSAVDQSASTTEPGLFDHVVRFCEPDTFMRVVIDRHSQVSYTAAVAEAVAEAPCTIDDVLYVCREEAHSSERAVTSS